MSKLILTVKHLLALRAECYDLYTEAKRAGDVDLIYHLHKTETAIAEASEHLAVFEHNPESGDYGPV